MYPPGKPGKNESMVEGENTMRKIWIYKIKEKFSKVGKKWDEMAQTKDTVIEFAHANINAEPIKMLDENHFSMEYCLAHSGESINERLRGNRADDIDKKIIKMVQSHRTATPLILYRGVCEHSFELMIKNAKEIKDVDLLEKGFLATSLVKGHELNYKTKLRIYVPEGTNCIYMGNVNDELGFYEVDIINGTGLRIISADKEYINCVVV